VATKKQKHEVAMARRERWLEERKASGLKAQKDDHEYREKKIREASRATHDKKHSWKKLDKDCILCQDRLKSQNTNNKEV